MRKRMIHELHEAGLIDTTTATALQADPHAVLSIQIASAQGVAVTDASGGATVDAEARTAINGLLASLRTAEVIAT